MQNYLGLLLITAYMQFEMYGCVQQRIRGFTTMRYINLRFTYLLTYLLTYLH